LLIKNETDTVRRDLSEARETFLPIALPDAYGH